MMTPGKLMAIVATAMFVLVNNPAQAVPSTLNGVDTITAGAGTTAVEVVPAPGDDLRNNGTYPTDGSYYLMEFSTGQTLAAGYDVEHDGSSAASITDSNNAPGTISAGTMVNAYLFHADSNKGSGPATTVEMTVTFDNPIIGLNGARLANNVGEGTIHEDSFNLFDQVGVTRFPGGLGHFDFLNPNDVVLSISADSRTITVRSTVTSNTGDVNGFDQLWVITEADPIIPEPATATLGLLALGGLGAMTRRRRA